MTNRTKYLRWLLLAAVVPFTSACGDGSGGGFARLTEELVKQLDAGNLMPRLNAHGRYNSADNELTTPRASFEFKTP